MKKLLLFVALIVLILGAISAALFITPIRSFFTERELQPVTLRLAWLHQAQFAGFYVAKEKGYYADAGLDVAIKEFAFDVDQGKELASGDVEFAVISAQELIDFIDRGDALKGIAVIYQTSPYAFASLKEHNITTPSDLKGKKLGIAGGNQQGKVTYQAILNQHEVPLEDVSFVDLGFDTPNDLLTKQADVVDLYRTDQTYQIDKLGGEYNLLLPEQFDFGIYGDVLATTNALLANDPEKVRKFTQATLKGWEYTLANPDEVLSIIAKYENEQYADPNYERHILEESIPLIRPTGNQKLGDMQYLKWKKAFEAMKSAGVITSSMSVEDIFTFAALEQ